MKRILTICLGILTIFIAQATAMGEFEYEGVRYRIISIQDKTVNLIGMVDKDRAGELIIPENVERAGDVSNPTETQEYKVVCIQSLALSNCHNLTSVQLPASLTKIERSAFSNCENLKSVSLPSSLIEIGDYAFGDCENLKSINLPSSITSIGTFAFVDCKSLERIEFPESISKLESGILSGCSSLVSVRIPEGVTSIGREAFEECGKLEKVELPGSLKEIGRNAFYKCSSLISIELPEGVSSIETETFAYCSQLKTVEIPLSVKKIYGHAFEGCGGISTIWIPANIEYMGDGIFEGAPLKEIYYGADTVYDGSSMTFSTDVYETATLYINASALAQTIRKNPWKNFSNIRTYDFSGIGSIRADIEENMPYQVYDVNGVKVGERIETLPAGIYIVTQGTTTKKIAVK